MIKENLYYDPKNGKLFWVKSPRGNVPSGSEAGTIKSNGYRRIKISGYSFYAHRVVWFMHYGSWPKREIDHINGNKDDNRIENLRCVSVRENQNNQKMHREGRLPGTTKSWNRWVSQIKVNGKKILLGRFDTEEEAHSSYIKAKKLIS